MTESKVLQLEVAWRTARDNRWRAYAAWVGAKAAEDAAEAVYEEARKRLDDLRAKAPW